MIYNQEQAYYEYFKHRYIKLRGFERVYKDVLSVVSQLDIPYSLKNIDKTIEKYLDTQNIKIIEKFTIYLFVKTTNHPAFQQLISSVHVSKEMEFMSSILNQANLQEFQYRTGDCVRQFTLWRYDQLEVDQKDADLLLKYEAQV